MTLTFFALTLAHATLTPFRPASRYVCEEVLNPKVTPGPLEFYTSGNNERQEEQMRSDAAIVTDLAARMGYAVPAHTMYVVPDEQMNMMAMVGGQPLPHWQDGHTITTQIGSVMGVLEFVTPGCPTCRSFYSDKTRKIPQRSVMFHVVGGHNDVSVTARVIAERKVDPPADALRLAKRITRAYEEVGHDEVSLFVQQIKSLGSLQDFAYGAVELPDRFKVTEQTSEFNPKETWPRTANALQALVHQFDPSAPAWKREILALYEKVMRVYPAYAQSKIYNEGWSVMAQYLMARHAPEDWRTSKDIIEYAALMYGVAYPSLSNPYWLGVMGWWNKYEQFKEQPEIRALTPWQQDLAFIRYGRDTYAAMTDYEWVQWAVDQRFCDRWKLFIHRATLEDEMDPGRPKEDQARIALSRDATRIQRMLIRQNVDRTLKLPHLSLLNPALHDASKLEFIHEAKHDLALEPVQAAKTMFVIAQLFKKRVSVRAQLSSYFFGVPREETRYPKLTQADIEVDYSGNVRITPYGFDGRAGVSPQIEELLKNAIAQYKEDMIGALDEEYSENQRRRWEGFAMQTADAVTDPAMEIVQFAPFAGQALRELIQMIETRLPKALRAAIQTGQVAQTKGGVGLRILPEIPEFALSAPHKATVWSLKPPAPVDGHPDGKGHPWDLDDNGSSIAQGEYSPGDRFKGPPPKEKKKSKSSDDQDGGEPSDPQDGEDGEEEDGQPQDGKGAGSGGGGSDSKPTDIEVPLKLWGEMLAHELELPNLRRTNGSSKMIRRVKKGKNHKPTGDLLWHEIATEAYKLGLGVRAQTGRATGPEVSPYEIIREGMMYIDPSHYVVPGRKDRARPDYDAVLVVNVDSTYSMAGKRIQMAKNLLYNIKAVLLAEHPRLHIHFVSFSDTAEEVSEKKIWTDFRGGSTAYAPAIRKDREILAKYPKDKFNQFVVTIGDGETPDGAEFTNELLTLSPDLQYAALAITTDQGNTQFRPLLGQVEAAREIWPWIGTSVLTDESQIIRSLKDLFPKGQAEPKTEI